MQKQCTSAKSSERTDDAIMRLQHVAVARDLKRHVAVRHHQRRLSGGGKQPQP